MKKLIILVCIALVVHFWQLGNIPFGVANDEGSYIYSSYTIWQTGGYDIQGKFLPLSINVDSSLSPVPVYIGAPFVGILGLSPFSARLPFALASIGAVILLYLLVRRLLASEWIAFFSGLSFIFAPWGILVGRGVWDGNLAMFFYLLGMYVFTRAVQEKKSVLWSIIPFALAFYSYHAMKVFFIALAPFLVLTFWKNLQNRRQEIILFLIGSICIVASFLLVTVSQGVTRQTELAWSNPKTQVKIIKEVDFQREKSSGPFILREIFNNKLIGLFDSVAQNYFGAFSTEHLFTVGDINPIVGYGTFFRGALYIIDAPFLLLGLLYLFRKAKKESVLIIIGGLLIAPLPAAVASGTTYIIRALMMLPFLAIIIGCGIYQLITWFEKKKILQIGIGILTLFVYVWFVSHFVYQYVFQFSSIGSEYWNGSSRVLATYMKENISKFDNIYVAGAEDKFMVQYAIFNAVNPKDFQKFWPSRNDGMLGSIHFVSGCILQDLPLKTLFISHQACFPKQDPSKTIADTLEPLQIIWNIYEK